MAVRRPTVLFVILLAFIVSLVVASSFLLIRVGARAADVSLARAGSRYKWHVMMIGKRIDSSFWKDVYEGARETGEAKGAIVELIGPESDADNKSPDEYIDYAIAAKVSGILAYVSDNEKTGATLARARENGIPVITLDNDLMNGPRQAFVGVSSYELGKMLGTLIKKTSGRTCHAMVLLEEGAVKSSENLMLSGIREAAAPSSRIVISTLAPSADEGAGNDEYLRRQIVGNRNLDVIVCLNVEDTMRVVQAAIELNRINSISVIAFRESPEVLDYVRKGIISAVVVIDAQQMGRKAVDAMLEYLDTGNSNDYVITDMHVITRETLEGKTE